MEYPIVIEYIRGSENSISDALSRLNSVAVDNEVPADLARSVPSFACPGTQIDRLEARTDWLAAQRADGTISFVADLLRCRALLELADIELNLQLKPFADVWPQLVLEDELVKHCNKRAVSTRVSRGACAASRGSVSFTARACASRLRGNSSSNFSAFLVAARAE